MVKNVIYFVIIFFLLLFCSYIYFNKYVFVIKNKIKNNLLCNNNIFLETK